MSAEFASRGRGTDRPQSLFCLCPRFWQIRRGQLAETPGERSTPTCLPGTCPSRSPRMGAADPPRPGQHGHRIAVLFGQCSRLGLKPKQARLAPHYQPHLGRDGLAEG